MANENPARLFVLAAPSGAGKTTLVKALVERIPEIRFSISYTTRKKRVNETDGTDYFFVDVERFEQLKREGELLESALVFDNHYGTSRAQVQEHLTNGHHVLLEIDWQGARQVRASMPECVSVFILPPSRTELERRLVERKTDSGAVIARRLGDALGDMSHWDEFDYCIINDDLGEAAAALVDIVEGGGDANRCDNPGLRARIQEIVAS